MTLADSCVFLLTIGDFL